mgnify:CR=1 FL=1
MCMCVEKVIEGKSKIDSEKEMTPMIIKTIQNRRSSIVCALISPYPTVVIVVTVK